ncbi:GntR family transcriptional regulator [Glaciecola sp. SC05]|uniref:GntR family transcriptional regulator n=1 Tax=Glaciecola sp. SC05 TaxID=1987355 RepID=UPI0035275A1B
MTDKQPAETLYHQLKQDIRDNKLPVARPLKQEQLAAKYGVSRIPIRTGQSQSHIETAHQ